MAPKPSTTPAMCGTVRLTPNTAPEAISIRLLGPGVIEATTTNSSRPANRVSDITARSPSRRRAAAGVLLPHPLGLGRILQQLEGRADRTRGEVAAAVRADAAERPVHAVG